LDLRTERMNFNRKMKSIRKRGKSKLLKFVLWGPKIFDLKTKIFSFYLSTSFRVDTLIFEMSNHQSFEN
jgi:hypothetical protein